MKRNSEATVRLMEGKDCHESLSIYTRLLLPSGSKYRSVSRFHKALPLLRSAYNTIPSVADLASALALVLVCFWHLRPQFFRILQEKCCSNFCDTYIEL